MQFDLYFYTLFLELKIAVALNNKIDVLFFFIDVYKN